MTANGEQLRLYHNGNLVASTDYHEGESQEHGSLWIGTNARGRKLWDGRIDELAMFDRALTAEDIASLFDASFE